MRGKNIYASHVSLKFPIKNGIGVYLCNEILNFFKANWRSDVYLYKRQLRIIHFSLALSIKSQHCIRRTSSAIDNLRQIPLLSSARRPSIEITRDNWWSTCTKTIRVIEYDIYPNNYYNIYRRKLQYLAENRNLKLSVFSKFK